ncbi:mitochondrial carrier [Ascobolus immersus RN42]|uniref:Mitochondrial carrier n=1 Tax=Ascobolus immersus RN42 TaxID=1160509 RepID=A0A3N4IAE6_ASCIM|nr:mitochondrial carrier [Ascobolus immersus RN42]
MASTTSSSASSTREPLIASPFARSLLAGGLAGTSVDLSLYPLDTIKTRLQSAGGFFANGGFSGIYRGVGAVILGSAPGASLFFVTYDGFKTGLTRHFSKSGELSEWNKAGVHMLAASAGEVAACAVRVPTEVVKQRAQAGQYSGSSAAAFRAILANPAHRILPELYRGWGITIMREIPFTMLQFPMWEWMKRTSAEKTGRKKATALESAVFGSWAGGISAGLTTPLDVLKTRLMLSKEKTSVGKVLRGIIKEEGWRKLFSGIGPRCMWISIGGAIFLGAYDAAAGFLEGKESEVKEDVNEL